MDCDIHMYVEYDRGIKYQGGPKQGMCAWDLLLTFDEPRNYTFFDILSGTRGPGPGIAPGRGVPKDAGWQVVEANTYIPDDEGKWFYDSDGCVIRHPVSDWHSHSWCTTEEFSKAIQTVLKCGPSLHYGIDVYIAILAAMRSMEAGGKKCRVIFWYDN